MTYTELEFHQPNVVDDDDDEDDYSMREFVQKVSRHFYIYCVIKSLE